MTNGFFFSENTTLVPSEQVSFLPNKRNISNAILVLNPITMKNRGNFFCSGKNAVVFDPVISGASYVRIKGKTKKTFMIIYKLSIGF